jgi:hypothetical protein
MNNKYIQEKIGKLFLEFVFKFPKNKRDWYSISSNNLLCWENFIKLINDNNFSEELSRINIGFDKPGQNEMFRAWRGISKNPNITMDIIEQNKQYPWEYKYVSENPNLTFEFIQNNINVSWDWYKISKNPNNSLQEFRYY